MCYMEFLVEVRVFDEVELGFLTVGHMHEDIDQVFSQISARVHANNAVLIQESYSQLAYSNHGHTHMQNMKRVVNGSVLTLQISIRRIDNITGRHHFKFCRSVD